jgi:hypothetical protein
MASTYSPILRTELIGSGDQSGTWGTTTNNNFQYIFEQAIAGYQVITITPTTNNQVLTFTDGPSAVPASDQSIYAILKLNAGTVSANFNIYAPPASKSYFIWNNSGYTATFYNSTVIGNTTAAGTGVAIHTGRRSYIVYTGVDFYYEIPSTSAIGFSFDNITNAGTLTSTPPTITNFSGTAVTLANQTTNGNIAFRVSIAGVPTTVMTINGSTGTISGQQITANYADVAERFAADTEYEAGTVVELGGSQEITRSNEDLSDKVFGVISTRAAYLMNSQAGSDATHPPVAMTGRVPVRVVGIVRKGDRLVSAGNGLARSAQANEITAFNVIGRALVDKLDSDHGMVEAIVTIK